MIDEEDDLFELAMMSRRSISMIDPGAWIPGRKVHVITTNTPKLPAVKPAPRSKREKPETLKEKKDRLLREIAILEGKRGKK